MSISIKTIAERAGTSISSVSRVLNNSGYVSAEVREKVERAIRELNYMPNRGARMLRGEPSRMIGLILPSIRVPFFAILAHAVEQQLFSRGYQTLICSTSESAEHEERYLSMLRAQQVDGVILASTFGSLGEFSQLVSDGVPVIAVDRALPGLAQDSIMADHREGGRIMARHLLSLGHRRIGISGAPRHSPPIRLRIEGITEVLAEAGLSIAGETLGIAHSVEGTHRLATHLLRRHPDITAIAALTDIAAIGTIHAARDLGLRVPEDLSVIGFDDLPEALYVLPQLTTIAQPIAEVGRLAVERLLLRIGGNDQPTNDPRLLPVKLVVRGSTGPVRTTRPVLAAKEK